MAVAFTIVTASSLTVCFHPWHGAQRILISMQILLCFPNGGEGVNRIPEFSLRVDQVGAILRTTNVMGAPINRRLHHLLRRREPRRLGAKGAGEDLAEIDTT